MKDPESTEEETAGFRKDTRVGAEGKRTLLTRAEEFRDVSRGNPKPFALKGEALIQARLTAETWRLEITSDGSAQLEKPRRRADGTALDLPALEALGKRHGIKFLKAMQCLNIAQPLGQGLWEGVPLREILKTVGKVNNVRRVYYWGFHNNDPAQVFQSSLGYNQVMETPPWDLPPFVAFRLNGEPISLLRGGPVRLIVPWAHGFKSIKWLQRITLTNDFRANDTYANANNDPDSYLKTAAYLDDGPATFQAGREIVLSGTVMVGWSGLRRVECWLRPDAGTHGRLLDDDPAWRKARWQPARLSPLPEDWSRHLPTNVRPGDVWGFDRVTGRPREWPLRFSVVSWTASFPQLAPGAYEFRARAVDLNGYAQPEPRPYPKSGRNEIQCRQFTIAN
jgi:DMSO/TMAO reductase YedYZ molybdopterin-dependent catalytic subunit